MGVLSDADARPKAPVLRHGVKFVGIYRGMDADDQQLIRKWWGDPEVTIVEIWRRVAREFDVGRSCVEAGLKHLVEVEGWES